MTNNQKFILKLIIAAVAVASFVLILPRISGIITILVLSVLFFTILDPVVDRFERFNLARAHATLITLLAIFIIIGSGVSALIPIFNDARLTATEALKGDSLEEQVNAWVHNIQSSLPFVKIPENTADKIISTSTTFIKEDLPGFLLSLASAVGNILSNLFFIIFITFFLLKDERSLKKSLINAVPNRYFELSVNLMYKIQSQLSSYLQGQFTAAMSVGLLSTVGLLMLNLFLDAGISYAVVIGVWAGLANLIPYVGPVAGAVPAIMIVLFHGPANMLVIVVAIIVVFAVVQMIDNIFISPMVVGKSVDMHPLMVFLVLLIGGNLMGLLGMMFAVPVAGIIKVTTTLIINNSRRYRL